MIMPAPQNAMEIFLLLDKSNCQLCGKKTCLAFAGAVFKGEQRLAECPQLAPETVARYDEQPNAESQEKQNGALLMQQLQKALSQTDLAAAAARAGARYRNGKVTLKVLGKDFSVDANGNLTTDIHVNPWVVLPLLNYLLYASGVMPRGSWVGFRELRDGAERYPLFQKRCEEPMKHVADRYTDLFDDMVHLFGGRQVAEQFEADVSVVLQPLPRVPVMVCYWSPEDGLGSSLNLFFDTTADANLDIGSIFTLGAGLAQMFAKIAQRHGF
jgi:hypothetical protein